MNNDEPFAPETIEEQIDQHTFSPLPLPLSPNARVIQELQAYYEEDQRSSARMWERLTQYMQNAHEIPTGEPSIEQSQENSFLEMRPVDQGKQERENTLVPKMSASSSSESQASRLSRQKNAGQMGASSTPARKRISRRTLVASIGVGVAALGTAASYVFLSGRLTALRGGSQEGGSPVSTPTIATATPTPTGTEPPANGKLGSVLTTYKGQSQQVTDARWSPDGSLIASASDDKTVQIWDAASGKIVFTYNRHTDEVNSVDWSPNGQFLVSGGGNISENEGVHDYSVHIWNASSGLIHKLSGPADYIRPIRWSPDGKYIAAACYDSKAYVWEAATGHLIKTYTGHSASLTGLAWSPDGKLIVTCSTNLEVHIWDATTGKLQLQYTNLNEGLALATSWSPDGKLIATATGGVGAALVNVWNATTGQTLFVYQGHNLTTWSGSSSEGNALSASFPFTPIHPASGSGIGVFSVAWSPDSQTVASGGGSGDGSVQLWKPTSQEKVYTFPSSNGGSYVNSLDWSPSGGHIASASDTFTTIWQSKA